MTAESPEPTTAPSDVATARRRLDAHLARRVLNTSRVPQEATKAADGFEAAIRADERRAIAAAASSPASPDELWAKSVEVGRAVNHMADQIVGEGFPSTKRGMLVRWLTWVAFMGAHPEAVGRALDAASPVVGQRAEEPHAE